jgi:hypothetical protein
VILITIKYVGAKIYPKSEKTLLNSTKVNMELKGAEESRRWFLGDDYGYLVLIWRLYLFLYKIYKNIVGTNIHRSNIKRESVVSGNSVC